MYKHKIDINKFIAIVKNFDYVAILPHMNPDPDALSSSWGMQYILDKFFNIKSDIYISGIIGRVENKAMVKYLGIKFRDIAELEYKEENDVLYMVMDTVPFGGNMKFDFKEKDFMIFDHHILHDEGIVHIENMKNCLYCDIDPKLGATATMISQYIDELGLNYDTLLATALYYGIKTDTLELSRSATGLDKYYYEMNFVIADKDILFHIEHQFLPYEYFNIIRKGIENTIIYGNIIISNLGYIDIPDYVAQIADFLVRYENVDWVLSIGIVKKYVIISVRNRMESQDTAKILRDIMGDMGECGGHSYMAGGKIIITNKSKDDISSIINLLVNRVKKYFNLEQIAGRKFE